MKSPFPGMDPFLERRWLDLHPRLIVESSKVIQRQLGDDLVAQIEERLVVEEVNDDQNRIGPDIRVIETPARRDEGRRDGGGTAVALATRPVQSVRLTQAPEPIKQRSIKIVEVATGGRVITVIEFLSPTNKSSPGRKQYLKKQRQCYNGEVNLVEVDLTRGKRRLLCHRWADAARFDSDYQVSIWRSALDREVELFPISIRQRLPEIPIPLRAGETEAKLDLQALLDECYADARYDRTIDYGKPPDPPLDADDADWARSLILAAK